MKKIILPLLGIAFAFSFTGKKNLPTAVAASITAKYPDVRIKGWIMVNDHYKVKINEEGNKEITYFSTNGKWLRTEKHLGLIKDLPAAVKHSFQNGDYAAWRVESIKEISTPDQPRRYLLHIDDGNQLDSWHYDAFKIDLLLYYDTQGTLVEKRNVR